MKKVAFIGQAMPKVKRNPHDWPSLNNWLYSINITNKLIRENFLYSALVDYFPGSENGQHLVPTKEQIEAERKRLARTLLSFNPQIVVPVGKLSLSYCLNRKIDLLNSYIGHVYKINPYQLMKGGVLVIPLPHPSGSSVWRHKEENKRLLFQALNRLKTHALLQ